MRAAATDRRPICPPATGWHLSGGAYLDGDEIVLPEIESVAEAFVPTFGAITRLVWQPWVYIPSPGERMTLSALHLDPSRNSSVPQPPPTGAGWYPPMDAWTRLTWTLHPRPTTYWLRLRITVGRLAGRIPGYDTRYRPQPTDWTFTYL